MSNDQNHTSPFPTPIPTDNSTSSLLTLPDGRQLGYAQYGVRTGKPIFFLHGLPGSRLEGAYFDALGKELGAWIIAPDRPGCGWSSRGGKGRRVMDWAGDVEVLAGELGIGKFAVMGVSGGGPYALACAFAIPASRLISATLVCGLGPPDLGMRGADLVHRAGIPYGWRWAPTWLLRCFFERDPTYRVHVSEAQRLRIKLGAAEQAKIVHPKDKVIYADEDVVRMSIRGVSEALAQGLGVAREDGRASCQDWGFRIEDIRKDLRVMMWYGVEDTCVPIRHGVEIAARLAEGGGEKRVETRFERDTHSSIFFAWRREILLGILRNW